MNFFRFLILWMIYLISHQLLYSQSDNVGAGRAIMFDGIDDYVNLGNIYDDLALPMTFSAWIYLDPSASGGLPIFNSQDNLPIYNGFSVTVSSTSVGIGYGDGQGENNPVYRRGKQQTVQTMTGRWVNFTAIMRSALDMDLFVNGTNVGGIYVGSSNLPMASNFPLDVAKIGYWFSNGQVFRFMGIIDEIKIWNRALSETEVRQGMCQKLVGNEPGLIGYWDFNETSGNVVFDKSPKGFNGQLVGNPTRVFSGAPIGDVSTFNYPATTTSLADGAIRMEASNLSGAIDGVHLYEVKSAPSQTNGLNLSNSNAPYFGVFIASATGAGNFTAKGFINNQPSACKAYTRTDNSNPNWSNVSLPLNNQLNRGEYILAGGSSLNFDLGTDKIVCDQPNFLLSTMLNDPTLTYLWSTGENTASITVTQSGIYSVKVTSPCGTTTDQTRVDFFKRPVFDLGPAKTLCDQTSYTISTQLNDPNFNYLWNTTQNSSSIVVNQSGNYSVTVASPCGIVTDNVQIDLLRTPQFFSFGLDSISCNPARKILKPYSDPLGFKYLWQDGSTNDSFSVSDFGKYWVTVKNSCGEASDTISLAKYTQKIGFVPNVITPNGDDKNEYFQVDPIYSDIVSLKVLNRWGAEVFYVNNYKNDWNGSGISSGVYYVVVEGPCIERFKGSLTIIR